MKTEKKTFREMLDDRMAAKGYERLPKTISRQDFLNMFGGLELVERLIICAKAQAATENWDAMSEVQLNAVAAIMGYKIESPLAISLTSGVPSEDGCYLVKCGYIGAQEILGLADDPDMQVYSTMTIRGGEILYSNDTLPSFYAILSYLKLPEVNP